MSIKSSSRRLKSVAALAGVAALLAGCGTSATKTSDASPTSAAGSQTTPSGGSSADVAAASAFIAKYSKAPTTLNQTVPLKTAAKKGLSYVVIGCELPQCKVISDGAEAAAKAIGWDVHYLQYNSTDGATMTAAMQQALQYKPVAVSPIGLTQAAWDSVIPSYRSAKVFIVPMAVGDEVTSDVVPAGSSNQNDYALSGKILANWFIADSKGTGDGLVMDVPAYAVLKVYADSFASNVTSACSGCKLTRLDLTPAELASNGVVPAIVSAVQRDPKIKYVIASDGAFISGLSSALTAAGISGVKIAGGSPDITNEQALVAGTEAAWTAEPTGEFGWVAVDIIARKLEGMPVAVADGGRPQELLTKANVGTPENFLVAPANYEQLFMKLWKVS